MTLNVKLTWKIFYRLPDSAPDYTAGSETKFFAIRTGKKILRDVGGNITSPFFPLVLEPKSPFFPKLLAIARRNGLDGSKLLFSGNAPSEIGVDGSTLRFRFGVHVYGKHACITVECQSLTVASDVNLRKVQDLASFPALKAMVKKIIEVLAANGEATTIHDDFKVYPCMQIVVTPGAAPLSMTDLAAAVTRHEKINTVAAESVIEKNLNHQIDGTTTLVDRQGVLCYVPPTAHADETRGSDRRFLSCTAMIELAAAAQRVLKDWKSSTGHQTESLAPLILNVRAAIPNSTSAQRAWSVLVDEFSLVEAYKALEYKRIQNAMPISSVAPTHLNLGKEMKVVDNSTCGNERRVLCLAAATIELSTVAERLSQIYGKGELIPLDDGQEYALKFRDAENRVSWYVVPLAFQGQIDAAVNVKTMCTLLKPTIALMVGMCMSMPGRDLPVGTVVIPNEVMVFDHVRLTTEGVQHRPHGDRVDNGLFKLARLLASSEKFDYKVVTDKGLASATSKVENVKAELVLFIKKTFPDAAAFDMEGWGFYRAGAGQLCLWVKAVADAGESQGSEHASQQLKQTTQAQVTNNAIDFAMLLVSTYFSINENRIQ